MSIGELTDLMRKWGAVPADWRHFMEELERATIDTDKVLEERSAQLLETARKLAEAEARIVELGTTVKDLCDILNPYSHAIGEAGREKLQKAFSMIAP